MREAWEAGIALISVLTVKLCLQILREAELTVTNFHDLLCLMCPDFQIRVVKSAFNAAWVVLRGAQRFASTRAVTS